MVRRLGQGRERRAQERGQDFRQRAIEARGLGRGWCWTKQGRRVNPVGEWAGPGRVRRGRWAELRENNVGGRAGPESGQGLGD